MKTNINTQLYEKMKGEQERYREWLLGLPPEEILNHTYEYTVREDILMAMEFHKLPPKQAVALLESPIPLKDIFDEWDKRDTTYMEELWETVGLRAKDMIAAKREPPIYPHTAQYAIEHGERDAYFASKKAYEDCKNAIEESINNHYDGMHLSDGVLEDVLSKFNTERVKNLLAHTVQQKEWDGRFSHSNKEWAKGIHTGLEGKLGEYLAVESHPGLLDAFISKFRREVLEQKKEPKAPVKKHRERSDDIKL